MVSKATKLLRKLRNRKRNWTCDELTTILEGVGFEYRESGHRVFKHPEFPELGSYPLPRSDELAPAYAKKVEELVDEAIGLYEERRGGDE